MEAIVGETLLSASVEVLLKKIDSAEFVSMFWNTKLRDFSLLKRLKKTLLSVQPTLDYAKDKRLSNPTVKELFEMLRDVVFEVENLFDEINTEALRCKVKAEFQTRTATSQVLKNLFSPFKRFNMVINSKMQKLIERLERLSSPVLLSDSLDVLLEKIDHGGFVDIFRSIKLEVALLEKLQITLLGLQALLLYAENRQIIYTSIMEWMDMRYLVFEVSNLFDEIDLFQCGNQTPTAQVLKNLSSRFKHFNEVINSKLQKLVERLEGLNSREPLSGLGVHKSRSVWHETPASSVVVAKSSNYGRDNDKKKLKDLLLSNDGDSQIRVISIVGMGGIGKTTLAKVLYNDPEVKEKFELKVWVYISKDFDISKFLETILESISSQTVGSDNLNSQHLEYFNTIRNDTSDGTTVHWDLLLVTLQQILSTTNFLLVLDDVWDAKPVDWIHLMDIFNDGETGSRIIITTRDDRVALSMQTFLSFHYLRPMESGFWELTNYELRPDLELSYDFLSAPLKRCFAFCSIFPKKSILEKKMVVQLWIAEGLVESSTTQKSLEKVGEEYFDVLVSSSLIQRRYIDGEEENFEMHDLFHDLATMVSFPYCIGLEGHNLNGVYNLSYNRGLYDSFRKFDKLHGVKSIRTFLALLLQEKQPLCSLSNKVVHELLPTMEQLRVLSLSNYKSITEVPKSIGNLLYLQYLNLSHTNIERLPYETCKLYNLQFLLLSGCKKLTELPEDKGKLVNLRHLDVSDTALREMPVQIARLKNLQTLSDFAVSKHNGGLKIVELGKFPHLHGKLSISQLQNVNDPIEASLANMKMKEQIDELALEWDCGSTSSDSQIHSVVLEHLRPSTNLKSLTIKGYGGISFPNWLGDSLFSNMVHLKISNCDDCLWLPPLGQLGNLKELIIERMQSVQIIGTEFYGSDSSPSFQPFPSLEILHFENMQEWEEWNLIGGMTTEFPSLKTLSLSKCPKLRVGNIADKFSSGIKLELKECPLLVKSMPSSDHVFRQLMFPLNSLRELTIDGFPSPMSFPTDGLPKTLKIIVISNCENLEFLPHEYLHNYTSLEELKISYSCNSMLSFTLGALPFLKRLFIEGCKNLKSILIAEDASEKSLSFLRSIKIWDCNELESFPSSGLATPNLVYIALWKCEKLHSLPEAMNSLTGLQEMEIDNLPTLQSFVIDDLPISLQELTVGSVGGIIWNLEPTWEHLTCLSVLRINGNDTVNALMRPLLPASLVTLCICGFNDTSIDGKWLQHLTSLQNLEIVNAPKLKSLPKVGFPSSLSVLSITCCPLLVARLKRKQGKEWRKIAEIPSIIINDELIT